MKRSKTTHEYMVDKHIRARIEYGSNGKLLGAWLEDTRLLLGSSGMWLAPRAIRRLGWLLRHEVHGQ